MKIISKHRDFFDSAAGTFGIDKTRIFKRETSELKLSEPVVFFEKNNRFNILKCNYVRNQEVGTEKLPNFETFIIGFCGKLYIGWKIWWKDKFDKEYEQFIYKKDEIKEVLEKHNIKKNNYAYTGNNDKLMLLDELYSSLNNKPFHEFFVKHKIPYFKTNLNEYFLPSFSTIRSKYSYAVGSTDFILNPILKDYRFMKVFDTVSAFQEIEMYLFGVLSSNEKNLKEIDEKYRITARGMDKTSFRKVAPDERKERRLENKARKRKTI